MAHFKPVYVFVGGVCHTPVFFEDLMLEMAKLGYESAAVAYPTCGNNTDQVKQSDEIAAIQEAVCDVLERGRDVVLVLHSYGGWPGSRAVKGLDKEARVHRGKSTGIIEVVFLTAFLIPDNAPTAHWARFPLWLTVKDGQRIPNEHAIPLLFSDMNVAAQQSWFNQFAWQRYNFVSETIPDAPWHLSIPKTFIVTTGDRTMSPEAQFKMLEGVIGIRHETWAIKSINSGHEPFLSQPARLAQVLLLPRVW